MYIKVNQRNRPSCIVMLCRDRTTKKWCFVNLSTEHVCTCRFDTIDAAFADLRERERGSSELLRNRKSICSTSDRERLYDSFFNYAGHRGKIRKGWGEHTKIIMGRRRRETVSNNLLTKI